MGLLERLGRIIRANISGLLQRTEDPEKILEQAVEDMQQDLIKVRQAVAQAIASQKRTERQEAQAQEKAEEWRRRAQLALQKGNEDLARQALSQRQTYLQTSDTLQKQLAQQTEIVGKLKANMRQLEQKISEARTKKDMYIARARSAEASQKVGEMLSGVNTSNSLSAFERMEERVIELEASSEAVQSLGSDDTERKFAALESGDRTESELQALKASLSGKTNTKTSADSTQPTDVDRELEKLRSEMDRNR